MDRPSLTYITPVYNTADFLHDCLGSIAGAGPDTECVVVDDGSSDSSPAIIREFVGRDPRFRTVSQANRGLSAARNRGLAEARGRYVLFVDSDDFVDAEGVAGMLATALETEADIVTGNLICVDSAGELAHWGRPVRLGVYGSGADFLRHMHAHAAYFPMAQCYMVRRELLTELGLSFREGIMHEDELWTPRLLMHAGKTVASGINHYGYRTDRGDSLTHTPDAGFRFSSLTQVISGIIECAMTFPQGSEILRKCVPFLRWRSTELLSICSRLASWTGDTDMEEALSRAGEKTLAFMTWLDGEEAEGYGS
ncbi:MAG: glycosyltransferase [Muribaculaceae bacterium]|nr:glycosyltransferase [Muribaculaceae bacterium]